MSEQAAPAAPDQPAAGWSQIEARAFNAVLPALRSVGEWLPLSARRAVAAAVLAELKPELDRLADYENRITWHTTCGSCARILDSSIRETERVEQAEAAIARVRDFCSPSANTDALGYLRRSQDVLALLALLAGTAPAHDAGPTVAEAAADDRRYWEGKDAGEGP